MDSKFIVHYTSHQVLFFLYHCKIYVILLAKKASFKSGFFHLFFRFNFSDMVLIVSKTTFDARFVLRGSKMLGQFCDSPAESPVIHLDFAGNMDMCIAIRMAKLQNGKVYVQSDVCCKRRKYDFDYR
jgi:hypothetical protein